MNLNSSGDSLKAGNVAVKRELKIVSNDFQLFNFPNPNVVVTDKTGISREFQLMQVSFY